MFPLLTAPHSALAAAVTLGLGALAARFYDAALWRALWFRLSFGAVVLLLAAGLWSWHYGWWWAGWGVALVWWLLPVTAFVVAGALLALGLRRTAGLLERVWGRPAKSKRAGAR